MKTISIPPEFWEVMPAEQFHRLCQGEVLTDKRLLKLLWDMLGRKDKPPRSLDFFFNVDDLEKAMKEIKRPH
jgi:hypothetical protein